MQFIRSKYSLLMPIYMIMVFSLEAIAFNESYSSASTNCVIEQVDKWAETPDGSRRATTVIDEIEWCIDSVVKGSITRNGRQDPPAYLQTPDALLNAEPTKKAVSDRVAHVYYNSSYCGANGSVLVINGARSPLPCKKLREVTLLHKDSDDKSTNGFSQFMCGGPGIADKDKCNMVANHLVTSANCNDTNDHKNHCSSVLPLFRAASACRTGTQAECEKMIDERLANGSCAQDSLDVDQCRENLNVASASGDEAVVNPIQGGEATGNAVDDNQITDSSVDGNEPTDNQIADTDSGGNTNGDDDGVVDPTQDLSNLANNLAGGGDSSTPQIDINVPQIDAGTQIQEGNLNLPSDRSSPTSITRHQSAQGLTLDQRNVNVGRQRLALLSAQARAEARKNRQNPNTNGQQPPQGGGMGMGGAMPPGGGLNANNNNRPNKKKNRRRRGSSRLNKIAKQMNPDSFHSADGGSSGGSGGSLQVQKSKLSSKIRQQIAKNKKREKQGGVINAASVNNAFQRGLQKQSVNQETLPALYFPTADTVFDEIRESGRYLNEKGI